MVLSSLSPGQHSGVQSRAMPGSKHIKPNPNNRRSRSRQVRSMVQRLSSLGSPDQSVQARGTATTGRWLSLRARRRGNHSTAIKHRTPGRNVDSQSPLGTGTQQATNCRLGLSVYQEYERRQVGSRRNNAAERRTNLLKGFRRTDSRLAPDDLYCRRPGEQRRSCQARAKRKEAAVFLCRRSRRAKGRLQTDSSRYNRSPRGVIEAAIRPTDCSSSRTRDGYRVRGTLEEVLLSSNRGRQADSSRVLELRGSNAQESRADVSGNVIGLVLRILKQTKSRRESHLYRLIL